MSDPTKVWMIDAGEVKPCWLFVNEHEHVYIDERGQWRSRGFVLKDDELLTGYFMHRDQAVRAAIDWLKQRFSPEWIEREQKMIHDQEDERALRREMDRLRLVGYQTELGP